MNSLKPGLKKRIHLDLFSHYRKLQAAIHELNYLF